MFCCILLDWKIKFLVMFYFFVVFVIFFFYMIFVYLRIVVWLWKRSKNGMIYSVVVKYKIKLICLLLVVIFGFVICWGLSIMINLLDKYGVM